MAGRPTKPNHVKEAAGTLRKDRIIENCIQHSLIRSLPHITQLSVIDSDVLNDDGKTFFNFICSKMIQEGTLSDVYLFDIQNAAYWHQLKMNAQRMLHLDGGLITYPNGTQQISPFISILEKANKALAEFSNRYGLNLSASQKISMPNVDHDEFD